MARVSARQFADDVRPYLNRLFRAACRLTGNTSDADDLVQDTCLKAFTNARGFAEARAPLNWLMRVQYNLFVDEVRRRQRAPAEPFDEEQQAPAAPAAASDPELLTERAQQIEQVQRAFMKLGKDQRALLALRAEGYSLDEICEIAGLDPGALNARLYRARQSLARHYRNDAEPDDAPHRMESPR